MKLLIIFASVAALMAQTQSQPKATTPSTASEGVKPPVSPAVATDSERIEFLKLRSTIAEIQVQIAAAQLAQERMGKLQQSLQQLAVKLRASCKPPEQWDFEAMDCKKTQ